VDLLNRKHAGRGCYTRAFPGRRGRRFPGPEWRNWQTRETQNRLSAIPVHFEILRKSLSQKEIRRSRSDAELNGVAAVLKWFLTNSVTTTTR
jgi:hypothetical protein